MIKVPISCEEVTLANYSDFRIEEDKFLESNNLDDLIAAVKVLYKESDLTGLKMGTFEDEVIIGHEPSFLALYAHLNRLLHNFEPKVITMPFSFVWKGDSYYISAADTALVAGLHPITVGESITLLELTRHCGEDYEALYNLSIAHIAILLRKEGEFLPLGLGDREKFISNRKVLWAEAPMSLAMEVQIYFNTLVGAILGRFPASTTKQTKESLEVFDRVGWNSLIANSSLSYKDTIDAPLEEILFMQSYSTKG